eukprot:4697467-Amphidinium_carterae.1
MLSSRWHQPSYEGLLYISLLSQNYMQPSLMPIIDTKERARLFQVINGHLQRLGSLSLLHGVQCSHKISDKEHHKKATTLRTLELGNSACWSNGNVKRVPCDQKHVVSLSVRVFHNTTLRNCGSVQYQPWSSRQSSHVCPPDNIRSSTLARNKAAREQHLLLSASLHRSRVHQKPFQPMAGKRCATEHEDRTTADMTPCALCLQLKLTSWMVASHCPSPSTRAGKNDIFLT